MSLVPQNNCIILYDSQCLLQSNCTLINWYFSKLAVWKMGPWKPSFSRITKFGTKKIIVHWIVVFDLYHVLILNLPLPRYQPFPSNLYPGKRWDSRLYKTGYLLCGEDVHKHSWMSHSRFKSRLNIKSGHGHIVHQNTLFDGF